MSALLMLENKPLLCVCGHPTQVVSNLPNGFFPFWCECDACFNCELGTSPADAEQSFYECFLRDDSNDRYCWMIGPRGQVIRLLTFDLWDVEGLPREPYIRIPAGDPRPFGRQVYIGDDYAETRAWHAELPLGQWFCDEPLPGPKGRLP